MSPRPNDLQPGLFTPSAAARADEAGVSLAVGEDGLARITFDAPHEKINLLTTPVMERLDALLTEVRANGLVKGLILRSGKPGSFIAGADVDEIEGITDPGEGEGKARRGQQVLQRIGDLAVPTVAAINGPCLGGGLEMALACDFRIAADAPKALLGLPEVRLGILPGFGGTQRLPALIGLAPALDLILSGRSLDPKRGLRLGIVDRVVPPEQLDSQAERILSEVIARATSLRAPDGGLRDWRKELGLAPRTGAAKRWMERTPIAAWLLGRGARRRLAARVDENRYPAPYLALEAAIAGPRLGLARGLDNEARLLGELIATQTSKNLIFLFKATAAVKSDPGISGPVPPLRPVRKVGVVGAGQMGARIAAACAGAGTLVRIRDLSWEVLAKGIGAAAKVVEQDLGRGTIDRREAEARRAAISATTDWSGFQTADLVIEAVTERLEAKREVFSRLEELCATGAILATNTSSIPVAEIAAGARRPDRIVGMHFFNPVDRMPLVEVITTRATDRAVAARAVEFAKRLGKTPIVVKDGPGFLVNRLLMPYLGEALLVFEEGGRADEIDAEIRAFGMPAGPLELLDRVGLDVAQLAAKVLLGAFGERFPAPQALDRLTEAGRMGRKSGSGFYRYGPGGEKRGADREATKIAGAAKRRRETPIAGRPAGRLTPVQERLLLPMINEAAIVLGEGIARSPSDVDLALVLGAGFPPFRGGLLRYADSLGTANLAERLELLGQRHGRRFAPGDFLRDLARHGKSFHSGG